MKRNFYTRNISMSPKRSAKIYKEKYVKQKVTRDPTVLDWIVFTGCTILIGLILGSLVQWIT